MAHHSKLSFQKFRPNRVLAAIVLLAGTAAQVADKLEENFAATGSRGGYMIGNPLSMPASYTDIIDLLVPELRRRGTMGPAYPGSTLRANLAS